MCLLRQHVVVKFCHEWVDNLSYGCPLSSCPFRSIVEIDDEMVGFERLPLNFRVVIGYLRKQERLEEKCRRNSDGAERQQDANSGYFMTLNHLLMNDGDLDDLVFPITTLGRFHISEIDAALYSAHIPHHFIHFSLDEIIELKPLHKIASEIVDFHFHLFG